MHVVGSVNRDMRLGLAAHVRPGETARATTSSYEIGGKGSNQAVAASRAGTFVRFVGVVGDDDAADETRSFLLAEGIDIGGLATVKDIPTGSAVVMVSDNADNAIVIVGGANDALTPDFVASELTSVERGDVMVLQLESPLAAVERAAVIGRNRGATVILNAAPFTGGVVPLLRFVDVLVVNEHELNDLAQLLGQESGDPVLDADALNIRLGLSVVCTLGENGSYISTKEGGIRVPARRVEVLDTTGAGDTFIGYLAASLAAKRDWRPALEEASAASAITVSRVGAARSIPCLDDVLALSAG